jgi:outer membrane usher protein
VRIRWLVSLLACVITGTALADSNPSMEEVWLATSLNGQQSDDVALFVRTADGRILAPEPQVESWRLRVPDTYKKEKYVPLDALQGLSYSIDEDRQILAIKASAGLFEASALSLSGKESAQPPPAPLGGFLNYDVVAACEHSHTSISSTLEASVFGPAGAGVSEFLVRHFAAETRGVRLGTTWTVDHPASASSIRLGDSITGAGAWGGAVRFGGVQWASNYTTRPGFITMPLPGVAGEAALPSTLDLYVDNMLRLQTNVPSGPFRVDDVPIITGEGDIRLVVKDLLGRQQVISEPYYASPQLLRAGLQEYSFETGLVRNNFGLTSTDYGQPVAVATERVGFTDHVTGEAHGEFLKDQQTFGLSSSLRVSTLGVMSTSLAGSHRPQGNGRLVGFGFEHSARRLSLGGNVQYASASFARLGYLPSQPSARVTTQVYASAGLGHLGSVSVSDTQESYYAGRPLQILSARHSINVGWLGYLTFSVMHTVSGTSDTTVALGLSHSISARTSLTSTTTYDTYGAISELNLQQNLPAGRGVGYRVVADEGALKAVAGTLDLQGDSGTYEIEARQQGGATLATVSAAGGLAVLGGHVFPTRTIDDSFAVVQVGEEKGVRIYRENQLVGQTDSRGAVLIPGLRAYQDNSIRIEQADLPLDIVVDTVQNQAVPYYRSGVLMSFPVDHPHGALITVVLDDGKPLPVGAEIHLEGVAEVFPSGLQGEVYVTGLKSHNEILAQWHGHTCHFSMPYTASPDPLPHLGPFTCASGGT